MRFGFAIRHASSMDTTWTTIDLARAALNRGHGVRFIEYFDYEVDRRHQLLARAHCFEPPAPSATEMIRCFHEHQTTRRTIDISRLDILLLRAAPLDMSLITFATLARDRGVHVVNDPSGVVVVSHKAWLAAQSGLPTPNTLVTRSEGAAHLFHSQEPKGVIVKPARGRGGRAIAHVRPGDGRSLSRGFHQAREAGDGYVVLQTYVTEASKGEKRLVWVDGEILGGYLRQRPPNDFRHNLSRGATAVRAKITPRDHALAAKLAPALLSAGIRIAGLDILGDTLTEVNALNPGGTFHTDRLTGSELSGTIIGRLESFTP